MKSRTFLIFVFALLIIASACNMPTISIPPPEPSDTPTPVTATDTPVSPSDTPTPVPSFDPSGWLTYANDVYGFGLLYPPDGTLNVTDSETARIDLPITAGTNLVEKWLDIHVQSAAIALCSSPQTAGFDPTAISTDTYTVNGYEFRRESGSEGAAGSIYDFIGYSTTYEGACISLTFILHAQNPAMIDPAIPVFDAAAESAIFEFIVGTFYTYPPSGLPAWLTYKNPTHSFHFLYPPDGILTETSSEEARIDLTIAPGTNLGEKFMVIEVANTGGDTCSSPQANGFALGSFTSEMVTINGMEFLKEAGSDGAAGNQYDWVAYSISRGCTCISLSFVLHSTNLAMYSTPPPAFDMAAESEIFEQIVATLIPPPGSAVYSGVDTSGWQRYTNILHGFEIRYSGESWFTDYGPTHAAVFLPFIGGTNLKEKYVHINVMTGTTLATCKSPHATIINSTTNVTINCVQFKKEEGGDAGMGNYYDFIGYSAWNPDGTCVSMTLILHSTNPYLYGGAPLPEFNRALEVEIFDIMISTFRWLIIR
jgi:hypothetical protein